MDMTNRIHERLVAALGDYIEDRGGLTGMLRLIDDCPIEDAEKTIRAARHIAVECEFLAQELRKRVAVAKVSRPSQNNGSERT